MDKIDEFAGKVSKKDIVANEGTSESVKEELLDGRVVVEMIVSRPEGDIPSGEWKVMIRDLLPEGKEFKDYDDPEKLSEELNVSKRYELDPHGFSFLGENFEEIENQLHDIIRKHFGINPFEPTLEEVKNSNFDIQFHDSFTVFDWHY